MKIGTVCSISFSRLRFIRFLLSVRNARSHRSAVVGAGLGTVLSGWMIRALASLCAGVATMVSSSDVVTAAGNTLVLGGLLKNFGAGSKSILNCSEF